MAKPLRISVWNASGLCKHTQEIIQFLQIFDIDILLISETHFTSRSYIKVPNHIVYNTQHPDETAHGGTAITIRQNVKHHIREEYKQEHIQATSIALQDDSGELNIAAVYSPPKYVIKEVDYTRFFHTLGQRFLAGGDYNAKHVMWGASITTTKGRELYKAMSSNNLQYLSTRQRTFWPSDRDRQPDLLDFCITKGINTQTFEIASCLELSSDHTPIIVTIHIHIIKKQQKPSLHNKYTDWDAFREILEERMNTKIPLKSKTDIEKAVATLTVEIQQAARMATPPSRQQHLSGNCPLYIKQKLTDKLKTRRRWQITRAPEAKLIYNKHAKELKHLLHTHKNTGIQQYLENLTPQKTQTILYGKRLANRNSPSIIYCH